MKESVVTLCNSLYAESDAFLNDKLKNLNEILENKALFINLSVFNYDLKEFNTKLFAFSEEKETIKNIKNFFINRNLLIEKLTT
jgi:hypothetical protein